MKHCDLNANAVLRLSELACLVDAIPARFRTPIMEAALGMLPAVDWQGSPLVQSLRSQIQYCVDDCVGFSIDDRAWRVLAALDAVAVRRKTSNAIVALACMRRISTISSVLTGGGSFCVVLRS